MARHQSGERTCLAKLFPSQPYVLQKRFSIRVATKLNWKKTNSSVEFYSSLKLEYLKYVTRWNDWKFAFLPAVPVLVIGTHGANF